MSDCRKCHWLWVSFGKEATLLYGCLVHTAEPGATIPENEKRTAVDFDGTRIEIIQMLLDDGTASQIADSIRTQSTLNLIQERDPNIALSGSRHRLIDGFGRRARPTETYAGATHPQLSDEGWRKALDYLKKTTGVDFRRTPDRLGAFDIYDLPEAEAVDFLVEFRVEREASPEALSYPKGFTLHPNEKMTEDCAVHVELELDEEPVYSRLVTLHAMASEQVQAVPFDHYKISVFDRSGALVQFQEHSLLLRFNLNMSAMGPTLAIDDSLARSAQGLASDVRNRASKVQTRSTSRSTIAAENDAVFDVHRAKMQAFARRLTPSRGSDRWFHRGVADEVGVITHLNHMLDGGRVRAGTIVDPYFGIDTLKRVVTRVESLDVDLTVITSLIETDPETNRRNLNLLDELQTALRDLRSSGLPNAANRLKLLNLVDGKKQAFHDRYVMLTPHEGEREVYLLSNSLNRMAGNWPFCLSKLDAAAACDAALYIDGLASGRDISGSAQPTMTFQWPSNEGR